MHMGAGHYTFWPLQFHKQERLRPSVLLPFNSLLLTLLGDRNCLTTSMASSTLTTGPSVPPSGSGGSRSGTGGSGRGSSLPTVSAARMKTAASANFTMPPGTSLEMLTSQNWNTWSGTLSAILQLNDIDCFLVYNHNPTGVDVEDWTTVQKKAKAYLQFQYTHSQTSSPPWHQMLTSPLSRRSSIALRRLTEGSAVQPFLTFG